MPLPNLTRRGFLNASAMTMAATVLANPAQAAAQMAGVKRADLPDLTIKEVKVYVANLGPTLRRINSPESGEIVSLVTASGIVIGRRAVDLGRGLGRLESELYGSWEAVAKEGRRVAQPDCRSDPGLATKQSVEWVVEGLRQVVAA